LDISCSSDRKGRGNRIHTIGTITTDILELRIRDAIQIIKLVAENPYEMRKKSNMSQGHVLNAADVPFH